MPGESGPAPRIVAVDFGVEQALYFGSGIDRSVEEAILALPVQTLFEGAPEVLDLLGVQRVVPRRDESWTYTVSCDTVLPACPRAEKRAAGDREVGRGVGFAIRVDGQVVCEAVSVREDGTSAELWVHTDPGHRRRGYATQAAAAWFGSVKGRGLIPFYSHERENAASRRLADSLHLRLAYVLSAYP